eukprot:2282416-Pleurochrysis_carterae.AAC.1
MPSPPCARIDPGGSAVTLLSLPYVARACRKERFWRYLFDKDYKNPHFPGHFVKVTFKTNLTDKATDIFP